MGPTEQSIDQKNTKRTNLKPNLSSALRWMRILGAIFLLSPFSSTVFGADYFDLLDLARDLKRQNKLDEAAVVYEKMIAMRPQQTIAYDFLLDVFNKAKRYQDAIGMAKRLLELSGRNKRMYGDSYYRSKICTAYGDLKRYREAVEACELAIEADPGNYHPHWLLSYTYKKRGDFDNALVHIQTAITLQKKKNQGGELLATALRNDMAGIGKAKLTPERGSPNKRRPSSRPVSLIALG